MLTCALHIYTSTMACTYGPQAPPRRPAVISPAPSSEHSARFGFVFDAMKEDEDIEVYIGYRPQRSPAHLPLPGNGLRRRRHTQRPQRPYADIPSLSKQSEPRERLVATHLEDPRFAQ